MLGECVHVSAHVEAQSGGAARAKLRKRRLQRRFRCGVQWHVRQPRIAHRHASEIHEVLIAVCAGGRGRLPRVDEFDADRLRGTREQRAVRVWRAFNPSRKWGGWGWVWLRAEWRLAATCSALMADWDLRVRPSASNCWMSRLYKSPAT